MSSKTVTLTPQNFDSVVLNTHKTVVVDFWAQWCAPCRLLAPTVERLAEERPDLVVGKLNVDEAQEIAARYGISSIPTVLVFRKGALVEQSIGLVSFEKLQQLAPAAPVTA
jgi:thioredoxin